jgi:hypothetical protein
MNLFVIHILIGLVYFFLEITIMKIANCADIVVYAMVNMTFQLI